MSSTPSLSSSSSPPPHTSPLIQALKNKLSRCQLKFSATTTTTTTATTTTSKDEYHSRILFSTSQIHLSLGDEYLRLSQPRSSATHFQKALQIRNVAKGPQSFSLIRPLHGLGTARIHLDDIVGAYEAFREELRLRLQRIKQQQQQQQHLQLNDAANKIVVDLDLAQCFHDFGDVLCRMKRWGEGWIMVRRAVEIRERILGREDPLVGESLLMMERILIIRRGDVLRRSEISFLEDIVEGWWCDCEGVQEREDVAPAA